ncbi:MAG TPA: hypothetical protein VGQ57_03740 [Polyangiaceae bacterium]|jgi:hypothetical protein|nr:hypothetical protein [Polyangiaceae bacterium]
MTTSYDQSVQTLYRAPLDQFVEERKRLAKELAAAGEAKLFLKLPRPSVSAWVTNQLYWRERDGVEELFEAAARLRAGDLDATAAHRQATNRLVTRAGEILREGGHAASDAALRKVAANLAAIAAAGGFEPDPPGALKSDRDPPGFGALEGVTFAPAASAAPREAPKAARDGAKAASDPDKAREAEDRARAAAEEKRRAEALALLRIERRNTESALRAATSVVAARTQEKQHLEADLARVEAELGPAKAQVERLSARLAEIERLERGRQGATTDA